MMRRGRRYPSRSRQAASNWLRTGLLLFVLAAVAGAVGISLVGDIGLALALLTVVVLVGLGAPLSERWIMRLHGAVPVAHWQAPGLHRMVRHLAARAGLAAPQLYLIPSSQPNALTTRSGPSAGSVALTEGILHLLNPDELEGVVAHEIAHLRSRDTTIIQAAGLISRAVLSLVQVAIWMAVFGSLVGLVSFGQLLQLGLLAIVLPVVVPMLQAALSRTREFAADAAAVELTGKPWALASALDKLSRVQHPWFRRLFGPPEGPPLLRSHPSTSERIRRLRQLGGWVRTTPRLEPQLVWRMTS